MWVSMVGRLFPNCRFKNAVFVPTNRDYIDSMVSKIDSICTTFDSIICGGVHVHRLDFMKIELIRATFDSIIRDGENRLDPSHHLHSEFGNGTGHAHARSKHVPRGRCYFTGLMSFSFTSSQNVWGWYSHKETLY